MYTIDTKSLWPQGPVISHPIYYGAFPTTPTFVMEAPPNQVAPPTPTQTIVYKVETTDGQTGWFVPQPMRLRTLRASSDDVFVPDTPKATSTASGRGHLMPSAPTPSFASSCSDDVFFLESAADDATKARSQAIPPGLTDSRLSSFPDASVWGLYSSLSEGSLLSSRSNSVQTERTGFNLTSLPIGVLDLHNNSDGLASNHSDGSTFNLSEGSNLNTSDGSNFNTSDGFNSNSSSARASPTPGPVDSDFHNLISTSLCVALNEDPPEPTKSFAPKKSSSPIHDGLLSSHRLPLLNKLPRGRCITSASSENCPRFSENGVSQELDQCDRILLQSRLAEQANGEEQMRKREEFLKLLEAERERQRKLVLPKFAPKMSCKFCKNNGESADVYTKHRLHYNEKTVCPILRHYVCKLCHSTGDFAHTIRHCPFNDRKDKIAWKATFI